MKKRWAVVRFIKATPYSETRNGDVIHTITKKGAYRLACVLNRAAIKQGATHKYTMFYYGVRELINNGNR